MWNDISRKLERVTWSNLCYAAVCVIFTFYEFVSKSVLCFAGAVHGLRLWVMTSTAATIWTNNRQRILCSQELTLSSYPLVEQVRSLLYSRGTSAGSLFWAMTSAAATIWTNNMQRILCSQELASFSHPSGPWLTWLLCCNKQWLGNTSHHVPCQSHPLAAIIVSPRSCHVIIIVVFSIDGTNWQGTTDYALLIVRIVNEDVVVVSLVGNNEQREYVPEKLTSVHTSMMWFLLAKNAVANCVLSSVNAGWLWVHTFSSTTFCSRRCKHHHSQTKIPQSYPLSCRGQSAYIRRVLTSDWRCRDWSLASWRT